MPDAVQPREPRPDRLSAAGRRADHAGIARLADELLPALVAKLGSTHLGEIEVREGDWHVRLRRPVGTSPGEGRRSTDRASRAHPVHDAHGLGRATLEHHRSTRPAAGAADHASSNGSGTGSHADDPEPQPIATSPAVGIFRPGPRAKSGTRVRAGDALGAVDMLGVPHDVPAPVDGVVEETLVEPGTAVEYGQELIRLQGATPAETR